EDLSIVTGKLADGAVTTIKITDGAITTAKLDADAVTNEKLADNAVGTENIVNETILSEDIKDGEIRTNDISSGGNDKVLVTDAVGVVNWSDKPSLNTDNQKIDKFGLNGTVLELSVQNDGEADKTVDLGAVFVTDSELATAISDSEAADGDKDDRNEIQTLSQVLAEGADANNTTITNLADPSTTKIGRASSRE